MLIGSWGLVVVVLPPGPAVPLLAVVAVVPPDVEPDFEPEVALLDAEPVPVG